MRIRILFVDYEPGDDGIMPNAVAVSDEYMEDAIGGPPDWFETARGEIDNHQRAVEAFIDIPDASVLALFAAPTIEASDPWTVTA